MVDGDQTVGVGTTDPCMECNNVGENWLCLSCGEVHCSRYVNEHMVHHNAQTGHPITISYADISVWCYSCDSCEYNENYYYGSIKDESPPATE